MTRALRWILLLVVLAGACLVGYWMLDRPKAPPPQRVEEKSGDQLTEDDRRGLDNLIESKTKEKEGEPGP